MYTTTHVHIKQRVIEIQYQQLLARTDWIDESERVLNRRPRRLHLLAHGGIALQGEQLRCLIVVVVIEVVDHIASLLRIVTNHVLFRVAD